MAVYGIACTAARGAARHFRETAQAGVQGPQSEEPHLLRFLSFQFLDLPSGGFLLPWFPFLKLQRDYLSVKRSLSFEITLAGLVIYYQDLKIPAKEIT